MTLKLYGPYKRPDGRSHVIWYDSETNTRITQSYPRYLMEQHLGRKLKDWEQIDHINEDPTDDRIDNFQIITCVDNIRKNSKIRRSNGEFYPEWYEFNCPRCGTPSKITHHQYRKNQVSVGKAGPYCSRHCAGKMHN